MNLLNNSIGIEQAQHFVTLLKEHPTLKSLCGNTGDETELDMSGKKMGASDVTMLRPEIIGNRSLLRLSLADNDLGGVLPDGWTYDDESKMYYDRDSEEQEVPPGGFKPEGFFALADIIKNNRTLLSMNLLNNSIGIEQVQHLATLLKEHPTLKSLCGNMGNERVLDMSGRKMGASDVTMLLPEIIENDALSSLNLLDNNIPIKQAEDLIEVMQAKENLATLCGLSGEETELNFSSKGLGVGEAVLVVNDVKDSEVLSKVTFSGERYLCYNGKFNNHISIKHPSQAKGAWKDAPVVTMAISMTEGDLGGKHLGQSGGILVAAFLPKFMKTLSKLNISGNNLRAAGGNALAEGLNGNQVIIELNVASNSLARGKVVSNDAYGSPNGWENDLTGMTHINM
jgi:hypothetical protein